MRQHRSACRATVPLLLLLELGRGSAPLRADGTAGAPAAEAAQRFDRGLARFQAGDYGAALAEFERAYALAPHPTVLLNIALVQGRLDRPVEALAALETLLAAGSPPALTPEQLALARTTRAQQAERVGELRLSSNVPAVIEIDGVEVARTPKDAAVRVKAGSRSLAAFSPGHLPVRRQITVAGATTVPVALTLERSDALVAQLLVVTDLPGVEVVVDGQVASRTPLGKALSLPAGRRVVELRRPGYATLRRELELVAGASSELAGDLAPLPDGPRGRLVVTANETDFEVAVDGQRPSRYREPLLLPAGAHRVTVARAGFFPAAKTVDVPASGEGRLHVALEATAETRAAYLEGRDRQRFWGWTTLTGGGAVAAAATSWWAINRGPRQRAYRERDEIERAYHPGGACDPRGDYLTQGMCAPRLGAARDEVKKRDLVRTLSLVAAGAGVASAALGSILLLTAGERDRYEVTLLPAGLGGTLSARF